MTYYVGLDVSLKETHLCVLQDGGGVVARGCVETAPGPLAAWLNEHAPGASVVVLETGAREFREFRVRLTYLRITSAPVKISLNRPRSSGGVPGTRIIPSNWEPC